MNLRFFNSSHMYFFAACIFVTLLSVHSSVQNKSPCDERREFRCGNTSRCIPLSRIKDGKLDCPDASDERCSPHEFRCRTGLQCVDKDKLFDGWNDCLDGSDEECSVGQFKCSCGTPVCIDKKFVKDGKKHCEDGSDEEISDRKKICLLKNNEVEDLVAMERKKRQADGDIRPTGLLTATTQFEIRGDKTTRYVTEVYGTYIANNYAKLFSTRISAFKDSANPSEYSQTTQGYPTMAISPSINEIEKSKTIYGVSRITETFNSLTSGKVYQTAVNELASSVTSSTPDINSGENEIRSFRVSNVGSSRHKSSDSVYSYNSKRFNSEDHSTLPIIPHSSVSTITVAAAGANSFVTGGSKAEEDFVVYAVQDGIVLDTADSITAGRIGAIHATGTFKGRAYPEIPVTYRDQRLLGRKIDSDVRKNLAELKPKYESDQGQNVKSVPNEKDKQLNIAFSSLYDNNENKSLNTEPMETITLFGFVEFTTTISGTEVVFMPSSTDANIKYHSTSVQSTKINKSVKKSEKTKSTSDIISSSTSTKMTTSITDISTTESKKITETNTKTPIETSTHIILPSITIESEISAISPSFDSVGSSVSVIPTSSFIENITVPKEISTSDENLLESPKLQLKSTSTIPKNGLSEVTGLVDSITGTEIQNGVTTHWATMIIGTYISGTYAHIIQSTSSIFFTLPSTKTVDQISSSTSLTGRSVGEEVGVINDLSSMLNSSKINKEMKSNLYSSLSVSDEIIPTQISEAINNISFDPYNESTAINNITDSTFSFNDTDSLKEENNDTKKVEELADSAFNENLLISQIPSNNQDMLNFQSIIIQPTKSSDYFMTLSNDLTLSEPISSHISESEIIEDSIKTYNLDSVSNIQPTILTSSFFLPSEISSFSTDAPSETTDTLSTASQVETPILEEERIRQPKRLQYTTLTYFTTYRSGDQYSTSSRVVTLSNFYEDTQPTGTQMPISVTEPATLQSNYHSISDANIKPTTYFTTFTYYTTLYKDNTTSVNSRKETVSRIVNGDTESSKSESATHTLRTKIVRGPQTHMITNFIMPLITPTPSLTLQRTTYFTTYTYYTTLHKGGSTMVKSRTQVISNIITGTPTTAFSIKPSSTSLLPSVTTQYTTYTFYTTLFHEGSSYVSSSESTATNVITKSSKLSTTLKPQPKTSIITSFVTLFHDDTSSIATFYQTVEKLPEESSHSHTDFAHIVTTTPPAESQTQPITLEKLTKISETQKPDMQTLYTTYTLFTTLFSQGTSTVSTQEMVVSNLATSSATSTNKISEVTQQTTLTYFTTLFSGTTSKIISNTEYITNVVTITDTKESEVPKLTQATKDISELGVDDLEAQADEMHAFLPSPITYYTTYTYYSTKTKGKNKIVDTNYKVVSSVLNNDYIVPSLQRTTITNAIIPTTRLTIIPLSESHDTQKKITTSKLRHSPLIQYTPTDRTFYNVYTYYTTNFDKGSPVVTSKIETKSKIIPNNKTTSTRRQKLDPSYIIYRADNPDIKNQGVTNDYQITLTDKVTDMTSKLDIPIYENENEDQFQKVIGRKLLSEDEKIVATSIVELTTSSDINELNKTNSDDRNNHALTDNKLIIQTNKQIEQSTTKDENEKQLSDSSSEYLLSSINDQIAMPTSSSFQNFVSSTPQLNFKTNEAIKELLDPVEQQTEEITSKLIINTTSASITTSETSKNSLNTDNHTNIYEAAEAQHHQKIVKPTPVTHYTTYTYFTTVLNPEGGTSITSRIKIESSIAHNIAPTRINEVHQTKLPSIHQYNRRINSYPTKNVHLSPSRDDLSKVYTTYTYFTTKYINGKTTISTRYETITNVIKPTIRNRKYKIQPTRTVHSQRGYQYNTRNNYNQFSNNRKCSSCSAQANNVAHRRVAYNYPNTYLTSVPVKRLKPNYRSLSGSIQHITHTTPPRHIPDAAHRYEQTIIPTPSTYYTTYTYFTTILKPGGETVVTSHLKVESSVGNRILPTRVDHVHRTRIPPTHGHNERVTIYPSRRVHVHPSRYDTVRTTYTYFTTRFINGRTNVDTRYETVTNIITATVTDRDHHHIHPTRTVRPGSHPYDTHRTTYTYHTTRFRDGTAIVNTRRETVTNVHPDIAHRRTHIGSYSTRGAYRPSFSSPRYDPAAQVSCPSCDQRARPRVPSARSYGPRRIQSEHTINIPNQEIIPHPVTHYTTYTHFTTTLINGSPVVSSRRETVTEVLSDIVVPTLVPLSGSANNLQRSYRRHKRDKFAAVPPGRRLLTEKEDVVYVTATLINASASENINALSIISKNHLDLTKKLNVSLVKNSYFSENVHLSPSLSSSISSDITEDSLKSMQTETPKLSTEMLIKHSGDLRSYENKENSFPIDKTTNMIAVKSISSTKEIQSADVFTESTSSIHKNNNITDTLTKTTESTNNYNSSKVESTSMYQFDNHEINKTENMNNIISKIRASETNESTDDTLTYISKEKSTENKINIPIELQGAEAINRRHQIHPAPVTHFTTYTYFTTILKPEGGTSVTSHLKIESSIANRILPTRTDHIHRTRIPPPYNKNKRINTYPLRRINPSRHHRPTVYTTYTYFTTRFINGKQTITTRYETITNTITTTVTNRNFEILPTKVIHNGYHNSDIHRTTYTYHTTRFRDGTALVNTRRETVTNPAYGNRHTPPLRSYNTHTHQYRFSNSGHCPGCQAQANNAVHRRIAHNYPNKYLTSVPVKRLKPNYRSLSGSKQHITHTVPPKHKPAAAHRYEQTIIPTPSTYYTTYTYFTTILKPGGETVVTSHLKVESSVGNRILPTRVDHVHRTRIPPTHGHNERVTIYPSRRVHVHPSRYDTVRTTYTYFTTRFINGRTTVDTRYETVTNIITATVTDRDHHHIHPTRTVRPGSHPYDTHRTTYTYHTTRFRDGTAIVNTRRETVTNVHPDIAHRRTHIGSYSTRGAYRPSFSSPRYDPAAQVSCPSCDQRARPRVPSARSYGPRRIQSEHTINIPNQEIIPHPVTHYTTYTHFTTTLINGSPVVSSRKETVTEVLSDIVVPTLVPLSGSANNLQRSYRRHKRDKFAAVPPGRRLLTQKEDVVYVTATLLDSSFYENTDIPSFITPYDQNVSKKHISSELLVNKNVNTEMKMHHDIFSVKNDDVDSQSAFEIKQLQSSMISYILETKISEDIAKNSLSQTSTLVSDLFLKSNIHSNQVNETNILVSTLGNYNQSMKIEKEINEESQSFGTSMNESMASIKNEEGNATSHKFKSNITLHNVETSLSVSTADINQNITTTNETENQPIVINYHNKQNSSEDLIHNVTETMKKPPNENTSLQDNKINIPLELQGAEAVDNKHQIHPTPVTHYTTYTYFTTVLKPQGGTSVTSHLRIESSIAHRILPTRSDHVHRTKYLPSNYDNRNFHTITSRQGNFRPIKYDIPKVYTTYTYFTTRFINGKQTISTRYETVTNIITTTVTNRNFDILPTKVIHNGYHNSDIHRTTYTYHTTRFRDGTALVNTRRETVTNPAYGNRHTPPLRSYNTHTHQYRFSNSGHCPGCQAQANNAVHRRIAHNYPNKYLTSVPVKRLKPNYRSLSGSKQHITYTASPKHTPDAAHRYEQTIIPTPSTYYTTYTYFTTILKPGGETVVTSHLKVESSVGNRILPTRVDQVHRTRIPPTHGHNERVTIYPSRRVHVHPSRYDTVRTTYTYFTTRFIDGRTTVDTRYETVTNIITATVTDRDHHHIHPTRTVRPGSHPHDIHRTTYTYHTTRFRGGTAIVNTRRETVTNANPDIIHRRTYSGSYNTRGSYRPSFSSPRYNPGYGQSCPNCNDRHANSRYRAIDHDHVGQRVIAHRHKQHYDTNIGRTVVESTPVTPLTFYTTYTDFTTTLINGSPVVKSSERTFTEIISNVVVPTLATLAPTGSSRSYRLINSGRARHRRNINGMNIKSLVIDENLHKNNSHSFENNDMNNGVDSQSLSSRVIESSRILQSSSHPLGLLSSITNSIISNGITTLFTTKIFGTFLNGLYAHFASTTSTILAMQSSPIKTFTPIAKTSKTGLVSSHTSRITSNGKTIVYTTNIYGTYIAGVYAQSARTTSNILTPSLSSEIKLNYPVMSNEVNPIRTDSQSLTVKRVESPTAKVRNTENSNKTSTTFNNPTKTVHPIGILSTSYLGSKIGHLGTTIYYSEIIGTKINGVYAHVGRTASKLIPAKSTQKIGLISAVTETEVKDHKTILHVTETRGTYLNGIYAHIVKSSNYIPTSTINIPSVTKMPSSILEASYSENKVIEMKHETPSLVNIKSETVLAESLVSQKISTITSIESSHHIHKRTPRFQLSKRPSRVFGRSNSQRAPKTTGYRNNKSRITPTRGRSSSYTPSTSSTRKVNFPLRRPTRAGRSSVINQKLRNKKEEDEYEASEAVVRAVTPQLLPSRRPRLLIPNRRSTRPSLAIKPTLPKHLPPETTETTETKSTRKTFTRTRTYDYSLPSSSKTEDHQSKTTATVDKISPLEKRRPNLLQRRKNIDKQEIDDDTDNFDLSPRSTSKRPTRPGKRRFGTSRGRQPFLQSSFTTNEIGDSISLPLPPLGLSRGVRKRPVFDPRTIKSSSTIQTIHTRTLSSDFFDIDPTTKLPVTVMSLVTTIKTLPVIVGFRTSTATITTTVYESSTILPHEYTTVVDGDSTKSIFYTKTGIPDVDAPAHERDTTFTEVLITTATVYTTKLQPIKIGYGTRTDTIIDVQIINTLTTNYNTINEASANLQQPFPFFNFPQQQFNPFMPFPQQQGFSLVTSENSFVTTETILSTKVLPIYRHGKTIYSTLTSTSTSESIIIKTTTVKVPQVPQVPHGGAFIIPQPYFIIPPVTTQITVSVTGANGQILSVVTTVTIPIYPQAPHPGFHGKFPRSVRTIPTEYLQISKTTDPTSLDLKSDSEDAEWTDESQFDNILRSGLREVQQEFTSKPTETLSSIPSEDPAEPDIRETVSLNLMTEIYEQSAIVDYYDHDDSIDDDYEIRRFQKRKLQQHNEEEDDVLYSSENLLTPLFSEEMEETPSEYFSSLVPLVSLASTSPSNLTSFQVSEVLNSNSAPTDVIRSGSFRKKIVTVTRGKHRSNFTRRIKITRTFSPTVGPTESTSTRRRGVVRRIRPGTGYRGQRRPIFIRKHRPTTKLPQTTPFEELTSVDNFTTEQDDNFTTELTTETTPTEIVTSETLPSKKPSIRIVKLRRPAGKNFTGRSRVVVTRKPTRKPTEEMTSLVTFDDDDAITDISEEYLTSVSEEEKNSSLIESSGHGSQLPITYYTTYTYFTTVLNGPITSYLSRESIVSNIATQTLDDKLVSVIKTNGGFSSSTNSFIPLGSKTHGTTTTVVNFASRLQVFNSELSGGNKNNNMEYTKENSGKNPQSSLSQENALQTIDIYELATMPKTYYTLLTHFYTFYDGLSVRHSEREETISDIGTDPAMFLQNTYMDSIDKNGFLTAIPETNVLNLGSTDILGTITQVNLGLKTVVHFDYLSNVAISGKGEKVQPTESLSSHSSQLPYDNRLDPTEPFADDQQLIAEIVPLEPSYVSSGQPDRAFFDITPVAPGLASVRPGRKNVRIVSSLVQKPVGRFRSRAFPARPGVRVRVRPALARIPERLESISKIQVQPDVQSSFFPNQPNVLSSDPSVPLQIESSFDDFSSVFGLQPSDYVEEDTYPETPSANLYSSPLLQESLDSNEDIASQPTLVSQEESQIETTEETESDPASVSSEAPKSATGKRIRIILRKTLTSSAEENSPSSSSEQTKTKPRFIIVTKTGLQGGIRPSNNRLIVTKRIRPGIRTKTLIRPTITERERITEEPILQSSSTTISPSATTAPTIKPYSSAVFTYFTTTTFKIPVTVGDQTFIRTLEKTNSRIVTETYAPDIYSDLHSTSESSVKIDPTYEILLKPSATIINNQLSPSVISSISLQPGPDGTTTHVVSSDNGHIVTSIFYPGLGSSVAGTKVIRTNQEGTGFTSFYGVIPESALILASPSVKTEIPSSIHINIPQPVGGQVSIGGKLNLVTRVSNGVTLIVASDANGLTTNTLLPEPTTTLTLQPTLLTDAVLMKENPKETIVTYSTKTFYTTYTFFRTFFSDNIPIVTSSEQVVTNLFTAPVTVTLPLPNVSILPRPDVNAQAADLITLFETKERITPSTRYSTSTFYATLFTGESSFVTPVEEVHSDVIPITETYTITRTITKPLKTSIAPLTTTTTTTTTTITTTTDEIKSSETAPVTTVTTLFTTFTKFLTHVIGTNAIVKSTEETTSNILTITYPQSISPPSVISSVRDTQTSIPIFTTRTKFLTTTNYVTLFRDDQTILSSIEDITPIVVTERIDQSSSKTVETKLAVKTDTTSNPQSESPTVIFIPSIKTYYTTYTFLTTLFKDNNPVVTSREVISTSYITQFVPQSTSSSSSKLISPSQSSQDLTTFTFFTTLFNGDEKTVISSETVISDIKPSTTTSTKDILTLFTTYTFSTTLLHGTDTILKSSETVLTHTVSKPKDSSIETTSSESTFIPTIIETSSSSSSNFDTDTSFFETTFIPTIIESSDSSSSRSSSNFDTDTSLFKTTFIPTIIESSRSSSPDTDTTFFETTFIPTITESNSFDSDTTPSQHSSIETKVDTTAQSTSKNVTSSDIIEIKTITSTESSVSIATETIPLLAGTSTKVNGSTIVFFSEIQTESAPTLTISSDEIVLSEISSIIPTPSLPFETEQNLTEPLTSTIVVSEKTEFVGLDNITTTLEPNGTLVLITGTDGAVTRLTELPLPISPSSIEPLIITETSTRPGPVFELTDLLSGNSNIAANIGEAIKGILNKLAKNNTVPSQSSVIPVENREKPPLPPSDGITVSNAEEPTYIPIGALGRSTDEKYLIPVLRPSVVPGSRPVGRIPGNDVTLFQNTHTPITLFTGLIIPESKKKESHSILPIDNENSEITKIITDETIFIIPTKTEELSPATNRDDKISEGSDQASTGSSSESENIPVKSDQSIITGEETIFIQPIIEESFSNTNLQPSMKESSVVSVQTIFFDTNPSISVITSIPTFITPILPVTIHSPESKSSEEHVVKTAKSEEITTIIIPDSAQPKDQSTTTLTEETKDIKPVSTIPGTDTTIFFQIPEEKPKSEITKYVTSIESTNRIVTLTTTTIYYTRESPLTISSVLTTTIPPRTFVSTIIGTKTILGTLTEPTISISKQNDKSTPVSESTIKVTAQAPTPVIKTFVVPTRNTTPTTTTTVNKIRPILLGNRTSIRPKYPFTFPTTSRPTGTTKRFKIAFKPPARPTEITSPRPSGPKAILKFPTPRTTTPAPPTRATLPTTRKPYKKKTGEKVKVDECYPECRMEIKEMCKKVRGDWTCVCRPGFAKKKGSRICEESQQYMLLLRVVKVFNETANYIKEFKNSSSAEYKEFVGIAKKALDDAYNVTDIRSNFIGADVIDIKDGTKPEGRAVPQDGVLVNYTIQMTRNSPADEKLLRQQLEHSLRSTNFSIGGSELYSSAIIENLEDINECLDDEFNDCSRSAVCINKRGTYECKCKEGYEDLDLKFPGRICSGEIKNCDYCGGRGDCIMNEEDVKICRCHRMYLGKKCEINGLVIAIALPIALAFLILLAFGLLCCCRRIRRQKKQKAKSNMFRGIVGPLAGTLDRKAMIMDTSSESSGEHPSRGGHAIDGFANENGKRSSKKSDLSMDRSFSTGFSVPSVMIPRARHHRSHKQNGPASDSGLQSKKTPNADNNVAENRLLNILEGSSHQPRELRNMKERSSFASLPNRGRMKKRRESDSSDNVSVRLHRLPGIADLSQKSELRHRQKHESYMGRSTPNSHQTEGRSSVLGMNGTDDYSSQLSDRIRKFSNDFDSRTRVSPMSDDQSIDRSGFKHLHSERSTSRSMLDEAESRNRSSSEAGRSYDETTVQPSVKRYSVGSDYHQSSSKGKSSRMLPIDDFGTDRDEAVTDVSFSTTAITNARKSERTDLDSERISDSSFFSFVLPKVHYGGKKSRNSPNRLNREQPRNYYCYDQHVSLEDERP